MDDPVDPAALAWAAKFSMVPAADPGVVQDRNGGQTPAGDPSIGQAPAGAPPTPVAAPVAAGVTGGEPGANAPPGSDKSGADGDGEQSPGQTDDGTSTPTFDPDAFFKQTLLNEQYVMGQDPAQDKCWDDFFACVKGKLPDPQADDCIAALRACRNAAKQNAKNTNDDSTSTDANNEKNDSTSNDNERRGSDQQASSTTTDGDQQSTKSGQDDTTKRVDEKEPDNTGVKKNPPSTVVQPQGDNQGYTLHLTTPTLHLGLTEAEQTSFLIRFEDTITGIDKQGQVAGDGDLRVVYNGAIMTLDAVVTQLMPLTGAGQMDPPDKLGPLWQGAYADMLAIAKARWTELAQSAATVPRGGGNPAGTDPASSGGDARDPVAEPEAVVESGGDLVATAAKLTFTSSDGRLVEDLELTVHLDKAGYLSQFEADKPLIQAKIAEALPKVRQKLSHLKYFAPLDIEVKLSVNATVDANPPDRGSIFDYVNAQLKAEADFTFGAPQTGSIFGHLKFAATFGSSGFGGTVSLEFPLPKALQ